MTVPARIGLITLACRDCEHVAHIFRALGWPEAPSSDENHTVFQTTNGAPIALYPAHHYEAVFGTIPQGFRGFTLCINLASMDEVRAAYMTLERTAGVELLGDPRSNSGAAASAGGIQKGTCGMSPGPTARLLTTAAGCCSHRRRRAGHQKIVPSVCARPRVLPGLRARFPAALLHELRSQLIRPASRAGGAYANRRS
ncbi:MAG: VOC family protein [Gaiellaceae bacterium]